MSLVVLIDSSSKMLMRSSLLFWLKAFTFLCILLLGIIQEIESNVLSSSIHIQVIESCDDSAVLTWAKSVSEGSDSAPHCQFSAIPDGHDKAVQLISLRADSNSDILRLFNLTSGQTYIARVKCDEPISSNEIKFTAGCLCKQPTVSDGKTENVSISDDKVEVTALADSTDYILGEWPIAIIFGVSGITICVVVAYYLWKKYQRRQRILRIFRQSQNDPFQALYSPTQDTYSF